MALDGYWREPDNWTNPYVNPKNVSSPAARRFSAKWNEDGTIAPLRQRAAREVVDLWHSAKMLLGLNLGSMHSRHGSWQRRQAQANSSTGNITHRPRSVILHKCPPGHCVRNNMCTLNRTGPACGLCPDGWAVTSAGCESCPDTNDPGMIALRWTVYILGGICSAIGYIFASWTPLMGNLVLPDWMTRTVMLLMGLDPDEEEEEEEEEDHDPAAHQTLNVAAGTGAGIGVAGAAAVGTSSIAAAALNSANMSSENTADPENAASEEGHKKSGSTFNKVNIS